MFANVFWAQLTACLEGTGRESLPTEGREGAGHGFTTSLASDSCQSIPPDSRHFWRETIIFLLKTKDLYLYFSKKQRKCDCPRVLDRFPAGVLVHAMCP